MSLSEGIDLYLQAPLDALVETAVRVRDRYAEAATVTYLVDRNINYSNVCITDCKFCEFYRPPGHQEAYVLDREVLRSKMEELRAAGGTRVLLQGGHHPGLRLAWYEDLLGWMQDAFPDLQVDGFSPSEIENIAQLEDLDTASVLRRLKDAGLGGLPGGGAEILDDEIRHIVSPKKTRTEPWLRIMGEAHALGLYTSASQVIGFGEEPRHRVAALERVRTLQERSLDAHGLGFQAFISWPLQHESRYGRVFGGLKGWSLGAGPEGYLRHTAFSRCFLDNVPHFQASWPTMGLEVAGRALHHGCDDMGGTMMEENVVSQAGSVHCAAAEEQVRAVITQAGFAPRKRDSWYRLLEPAGS